MFCLTPFCYVCLKTKEQLINLNNPDADSLRLFDKLLYCMPEIGDINVDIPLFICRKCRYDLRIAYTLRKKCLQNLQYVEGYVNQLTCITEADDIECGELYVTLVDCKRLEQSIAKIKSEDLSIQNDATSTVYYNNLQRSENDACSDTDNVPLLLLLRNQVKESADTSNQVIGRVSVIQENSNHTWQKEKLRPNRDTLKEAIAVKKRRIDNSNVIETIDITDSKDHDDDITCLDGNGPTSMAITDKLLENNINCGRNNLEFAANVSKVNVLAKLVRNEESSDIVIEQDHVEQISDIILVDRQTNTYCNEENGCQILVKETVSIVEPVNADYTESNTQRQHEVDLAISNDKPAECVASLVSFDKQNEASENQHINYEEPEVSSDDLCLTGKNIILQNTVEDLKITNVTSIEVEENGDPKNVFNLIYKNMDQQETDTINSIKDTVSNKCENHDVSALNSENSKGANEEHIKQLSTEQPDKVSVNLEDTCVQREKVQITREETTGESINVLNVQDNILKSTQVKTKLQKVVVTAPDEVPNNIGVTLNTIQAQSSVCKSSVNIDRQPKLMKPAGTTKISSKSTLSQVTHSKSSQRPVSNSNLNKNIARPNDILTNSLFESIRNNDSTYVNNRIDDDDDNDSRSSIATSMYESDVIDDELDFDMSGYPDQYVSDSDIYDRNDSRYAGSASRHSSHFHNTDYSDVRSQDSYNGRNYRVLSPTYDTSNDSNLQRYQTTSEHGNSSLRQQKQNTVEYVYSKESNFHYWSPRRKTKHSFQQRFNRQERRFKQFGTFQRVDYREIHLKQSESRENSFTQLATMAWENRDTAHDSLNDREDSRATVVQIKSPMSDVEDNYSNETLIYQEGMRNMQEYMQIVENNGVRNDDRSQNIRQELVNSDTDGNKMTFSFVRAYLSSFQQTDLSSESTNIHREASSSTALGISYEETNVSKCAADKSVLVNAGPEETKNKVYTSIRKSIPPLIDLNGSIEKDVSSTNLDLFKCSLCNETFITKFTLTVHTQSHAINTSCQSNIDEEILRDCQKIVNNSENVLGNLNHFKCQICDKPIICVSESTNHSETHNLKSTETAAIGENKHCTVVCEQFKCHICGLKFNFQSLLDCHLEKHSSVQTIDPLPAIINNHRNNLNEEQLQDETDEFKCYTCGGIFNSKSLLACHAQTHRIRMTGVTRGSMSSLTRYKIPYLSKDNEDITKENSVEDTGNVHGKNDSDMLERRMSVNENIEGIEMDTSNVTVEMMDKATDTINLHYLLPTVGKTDEAGTIPSRDKFMDKVSSKETDERKKQRVVIKDKTRQNCISDSSHGKKRIKKIDKSSTEIISEKINYDKTQSTDQINSKSYEKQWHSSNSSTFKKDKCIGTSSLNQTGNKLEDQFHPKLLTNRTAKMVDKAIETVNFSDDNAKLSFLTDDIERDMFKIHMGERISPNNKERHTKQIYTRSHDNRKSEKGCSTVSLNRSEDKLEKIHKKHGLSNKKVNRCVEPVHYYKTTRHTSTLDKTQVKSSKKPVEATTNSSSKKVDKSTGTTRNLTNNSMLPKTVTIMLEKHDMKSSSSQSDPELSGVMKNTNVAVPATSATDDLLNEPDNKCPLCERTFAEFNSLREHLIIAHKAYKKFQCTLCDKNFRQQCGLRYHMLSHTKQNAPHSCPICSKTFNTKFYLTRHMTVHSADRKFTCATCAKTFRYKDSLRIHMVLHTGVKAHKCPVCQRAFTFKGNMVQHVQTHTNEKQYQCAVCGKSFTANYGLTQHMRIHTGERPFKCPTCARTFTMRCTLVQHLSTHTDAKPFHCTICDGRFKLKQNLRRHMVIHTEDKPHQCERCCKEFRLEGELAAHRQLHDRTEKPFICDICQVGFMRKETLNGHNYKVHYKNSLNGGTVTMTDGTE